MSTINSNYSYTNYYNNYGLFNTSNASGSTGLYEALLSNYGVNNAAKSQTTYQTDSAVRSSGEEISSAIKSLMTTGSKSLFDKVGATSSDKTVAAVSSEAPGATAGDSLELNVIQTAESQINSGGGLRAKDKEVGTGRYSFEIQMGDKTQSFSINVSSSDNNESIQKKMAEAINDKNIGVTASVDYDAKTRTSTLSLASAATGNKNPDGAPVFTVADTRGDLAERMGITNISQEARNAIYSIDGGENQTSASNKISLGNGSNANLLAVGSTTISFERDGSAAIDQVKEIVSSINSTLVDVASESGRGSSRLLSDLYSLTTAYSKSLSNVGISVASNGVMSIDGDKLEAASKDGSLERLFQRNGGMGFANRVDRISSNMKSSQYYADAVPVSENSGLNSYYDKYAAVSALFDSFY